MLHWQKLKKMFGFYSRNFFWKVMYRYIVPIPTKWVIYKSLMWEQYMDICGIRISEYDKTRTIKSYKKVRSVFYYSELIWSGMLFLIYTKIHLTCHVNLFEWLNQREIQTVLVPCNILVQRKNGRKYSLQVQHNIGDLDWSITSYRTSSI